MRDPRTPRCSIADCTKAARRLGLCREHAALVPLELGVACAAACMRATRAVAREYHEQAADIAAAALHERAREAALR